MSAKRSKGRPRAPPPVSRRAASTCRTGAQTLERAAATLAVRPDSVERRECKCIHHDMLPLTCACDALRGKVTGRLRPTHSEPDFAHHLPKMLVQRGDTTRWHLIMDNLNVRCLEAVVRMVANACNHDIDLGLKAKSGTLKSLTTRERSLRDPSRPIVFHSTPKQASWLNRIDKWFSILERNVIRHGNALTVDDLHRKLTAFIGYSYDTSAKPFRWTYTDKPLAALIR